MDGFFSRRYKTTYSLAKIVEVAGWLLCLTIILIPFGLLLVLMAQQILIVIDIENNTRVTNEYIKLFAQQRGGDTISSAMQSLESDYANAETNGGAINANQGAIPYSATTPSSYAPRNHLVCPACQAVNTDRFAAYCGECGAKLPLNS